MDRIDMRVEVEPLNRVELTQSNLGESSATIRSRVIAARAIAAERFKKYPWKLNAEISSRSLRIEFRLEKEAMNFLHNELDHEHISARGLHKVMRTSWSIADLALHPRPTLADTVKAYEMREGLNV